jgi:hypothetical protein
MYKTDIKRIMDSETFRPYYVLSVAISPEDMMDKSVFESISPKDSFVRLLDEAVGQLKVDAIQSIFERKSDV